jgi:hypothetical protein
VDADRRAVDEPPDSRALGRVEERLGSEVVHGIELLPRAVRAKMRCDMHDRIGSAHEIVQHGAVGEVPDGDFKRRTAPLVTMPGSNEATDRVTLCQ